MVLTHGLLNMPRNAIEQHFGWYPADGNRDLEEKVLALIRWANEQPATEEEA